MHKLSMRQLGIIEDDKQLKNKPPMMEGWQSDTTWNDLLQNFVPLVELNTMHFEQLVRLNLIDSQLISVIRAQTLR